MMLLPTNPRNNSKIWAIQLKNTESKIISSQKHFDIISLDWKNIPEPEKFSIKSISLSVARAFPDYTDNKVDELANEIRSIRLAKRGDYVLGVSGSKIINKIGYIDEVGLDFSIKRSGAQIKVIWGGNDLEIECSKSIFNSNISIERVTSTMLQYTKLDYDILGSILPPLSRDILYEEVFDKDEAFATFKEPMSNYRLLKKDPGGKEKIFYGTNRKRTAFSDLSNYYSSENAGELSTGWCTVSIPKGHTQGDIERPRRFLSFEFPENPEKHITLEAINEIQPDAFYKELSSSLQESGIKAGLLFIHGYNTSFEEAAWRTAQISWDIPFNGIAGFFSWPSEAKPLSYMTDGDRAEASVVYLEEFIEKIVIETGVEKLHIIAHSMGNRVLGFVLKNLLQKPSFKNYLPIIRQIVLAAPDIDQKVFEINILPYFTQIGHMRTLYCSDKDRALNFSEILRDKMPRLGRSGRCLFVANGMDTVDSSNLPSLGKNHSYIFETKEVLSDLFHLFEHDFTPLQRRLKVRKKGALPYWLFPE